MMASVTMVNAKQGDTIMEAIYYSVVEDWKGAVSVSNYGGKTMREERKFAKTCNRFVHQITTNYDSAQYTASLIRAGKLIAKHK